MSTSWLLCLSLNKTMLFISMIKCLASVAESSEVVCGPIKDVLNCSHVGQNLLIRQVQIPALKMHYYALQGCTFPVLAVFQTSLPSTTFVIFLFTSFNVADSLTWRWCRGLLAFRLFYSATFEAAASAGNLPDWMFVSRGLASRLYTLLTLHLIPLYETGRSLSMLTSFTSL